MRPLYTIGKMPKAVFQVGCSDGYTLSEFQNAGASIVEGIDPSLTGRRAAQENYGVKTNAGNFEEFETDRKYELILLTHVLEHLYNPRKALQKCNSMQRSGDWVFIEVPLLEKIENIPGYFSFEHVNYFSESTLSRLMVETGYVPYNIKKMFSDEIYPIIAVMARKEKKKNQDLASDFKRANSLLRTWHQNETANWEKIEQRIKKKLKRDTEVYVWGAGVHTSQLFANTEIKNWLSIKSLIDSSPTKWGKKIGNLKCSSAEGCDLIKGDTILISSFASEQEIYESLAIYKRNGVAIERIYGEID